MPTAPAETPPGPKAAARVTARETANKLANEITTLCGYLYAGTYRLLTLIREFDETRGREGPGPRYVRPLAEFH